MHPRTTRYSLALCSLLLLTLGRAQAQITADEDFVLQ